MFTIKSIHISLELWGAIFCLIASICIFYSRSIKKRRRILILLLQLSTAFLLCMDACAWGFRGYPGDIGFYMVRISNFLVFLLSDVILLLFHDYVCSYVFDDRQRKDLPACARLVYAAGITGIILVILSQFFNFYYYFDHANIYHRNWMFPLSMIPAIIQIIIDLFFLVKYRKKLKKEMFISMISYIILPCIAMWVQIFYYGVSFINIAINISMIFLFITAMIDQGRTNYELKIDIMISQIKPHFIYNSLTTIKHLCKKDPELAAETIDEFAKYVRGNLSALSEKKCIPFEQELEHVKSYLSIEQKRFGKRIHVEYDIETVDFWIPPLTLQPIVENAVKHGITKKIEGGTIRISTSKEKDYYIVLVEDNGVGFDSTHQNRNISEKHIGIRNVKKRIENMLGGTMYVRSIPGKGTAVEILLPK